MSGRKIQCLVCLFALLLIAVAAQATSHVRIVRLSYVDGKVQMDRANGQGLERAILNSPIVEGSRIITGSDGLAEVEFEDNTVIRLGGAGEIRFSQLLVNDAGDKVNEVELQRGTIYVDARSSKTDIDRVIAAGQTFVIRRDSQVRFQMIGDQVQAAVFSGETTLASGGQFVRLKKDDTLTVDASNPGGYIVAKGVDTIPLDRWNNERHAYQDVYAYNNYGAGSKGLSGYGYQDLAYYGGFMNVPGYGLAWQPFGASNWLGWDPYNSGAWTYLGGFGYAWASAYPWGWMPYHYGYWANMPTYGWFWVPGNSFSNGGVVTNWQGIAPVVKAPNGYAPPTPPVIAANGPRPSIMVGRIGNAPAYLPDGRIPPNFRSVIQDHSGLAGQNVRSSFAAGGPGAYGASHNSRAINAPRANTAQNAHVFATPPPSGAMPSAMSGGYVPPASYGGGMGTAAHQSAAPMHNASGGTHVSGSSGGHGGTSGTPK